MADLSFDLMPSAGDEDVDAVADQVQFAEDLGYEHVSLGETTGWNAVPLLATLAERTDRIGLANDVFSPYSRSPALLAQTALTLHELSGGRNRLGLGTSSPALVEDWHGDSFDRPLRHLREAIEIVGQVTAGERVNYDGDCFDVGGLRYTSEVPDDPPPVVRYTSEVPDDPPPVDVAALGPKAVELAGRFADGWTPQFFTPGGLEDRIDDLRRGADLGDRSIDDVRVSLTFRAFASDDRERARDLGRQTISFMVGRYGPYYRQTVADQGYEAMTEAIADAWAEGDREAAAAAVDDDLLQGLVAAGTPEEVRETVDRFREVDGLDALRIAFFDGMTREEQDRTLEVVADGAARSV